MVRKADGYFADDGEFFERKEEAELHDVEKEILDTLREKGIVPEPILELIGEMQQLIEDYYAKVHAETETRIAASVQGGGKNNRTRSKPRSIETDTSDDCEGEAGLEGVQQQPRRRRKSVPNVGRRKRTEAVQDDSKEHGT